MKPVVEKLPTPDTTLRRLIEVAKQEGRTKDVSTLTLKLKYAQMARTANSVEDDPDMW